MDNPIWALSCLLLASASGWTLLLVWPVAFVLAIVFASTVAALGYWFGFDDGRASKK